MPLALLFCWHSIAHAIAVTVIPCESNPLSARPAYEHCDIKLGPPKEEAAEVLSDRHRKLLDGTRRIFTEPGLLNRRDDVTAAIGAKVARSELRRVDGNTLSWNDPIDHLEGSGGLFTTSVDTNSKYQWFYSPGKGATTATWRDLPHHWRVDLVVNIDPVKECLPSAAAEGYLDIPLTTWLTYSQVRMHPDRRLSRYFMAYANPIPKDNLFLKYPTLEISGQLGCLTQIRFHQFFKSEEHPQ